VLSFCDVEAISRFFHKFFSRYIKQYFCKTHLATL
jgi:hypothetical protein